MSHTIHNQGCRYATVQEEKFINSTHEFVKRLTWATTMMALAGIVERNAPIAFWAVVTSLLTWKALNVWAKVHTKHYIRIKEERQAKELAASGEDVVTISRKDYDIFTVMQDGVMTMTATRKEQD